MSTSRVWITTGTSSGIGQAAVREAIADGDRVAAITRKASSVSVLSEAYPSDKLLVVEYDVGNPSHSAEALFENVHKHFGRIDVVFNNAGYGLSAVVEDTTDEEARYQFEVNFWGATRISREAVKYFRENKIPGRLLMMSSILAVSTFPTLPYYCATKFALEGFSESLSLELSPEWNIKVIIIEPGSVKTEWGKSNMVCHPLPPAYDTPGSPANKIRELIKNTQYVGDAVKVSRALIKISKEPSPPLRLPLGPDSKYMIQNRLKETKNDLDKWDELILSTVADNTDPLFLEKLSVNIPEQH